MTTDVDAHLMFSVVSFIVFGLTLTESLRIYSKKIIALGWGVLSVTSGLAYYSLLNSANVGMNHINTLPAESVQHIIISFSLVITGLAMIACAQYIPRLNLPLRAVNLSVSGIIFVFHNSGHGSSHASWLAPYHRAIAVLLLTAAASIIVRIKTKNNKLTWVLPPIFFILGFMLMLYVNPSKEIPKCQIPGRGITINVSDSTISPKTINAKRCDMVRILSTGQNTHVMALGPHEHHYHYPGFEELLINSGESNFILLTQTGVYEIHDHLNETIEGKLIIAK